MRSYRIKYAGQPPRVVAARTSAQARISSHMTHPHHFITSITELPPAKAGASAWEDDEQE